MTKLEIVVFLIGPSGGGGEWGPVNLGRNRKNEVFLTYERMMGS